MSVIEIRKVSMRYGGRSVLHEIEFSVEEGAFLGIVGRNGAGKTTLIETIYGARRPTSGEVVLLGENVVPRSISVLRQIGIQSQRGAFMYRATAREHLSTVGALYGAPGSRVGEVLEYLGLGHIADTRAIRLSGGEKQRLALGCALIHKPKILFLDEPTAALDLPGRRGMLELLSELNVGGTTVIYTTHLLEEAEILCDRVVTIDCGRVVADGSPSELISKAKLGTMVIVPRALARFDEIEALTSVANVLLGPEGLVISGSDEGRILEELGSLGIDLRMVHTRKSTLEDAFVALTGEGVRQ